MQVLFLAACAWISDQEHADRLGARRLEAGDTGTAGSDGSPDDSDTSTGTDTSADTDTADDTDTAAVDADGDGAPAGEDCDDADPDRFPGAEDTCGDDIDQDCDEEADQGCGPRGAVALSDTWVLTGNASGDLAGLSLAAGRDVDGDEVPDLLVGAQGDDTRATNSGAFYLLKGPLTGGGTLEDLRSAKVIGGATTRTGFGETVAFVGDVNGDGLEDVATLSEASTEVYWMRADTLAGDTLQENVETAFYLGASSLVWEVAGAGDWDGDGLADVAVGGQNGMWVFYGDQLGEGVSAEDRALFTLDATRNCYGVDPAGDLDGDGYDEAFCSTSDRIFLFEGAGWITTGSESDARWTLLPTEDSEGIGISSVGADVDGDEVGDVLVAAPYEDAPLGDSGRLYVVSGAWTAGTTTLVSSAVLTIAGDAYQGHFAGPSSLTTDVNGDAVADLVVGAAGAGAGTAWLFDGTVLAGDLDTSAARAWFLGTDDGDSAGFDVAGAGDLDGDGFGDLVTSAPYADGSGAIYVVRGGR